MRVLICGPFQVLVIRLSYLWNWGGTDMNGALLRNSILDAIDSLPNLANNLKDYP